MIIQSAGGFLLVAVTICISLGSCERPDSTSMPPQIDSVITIGQHHAHTLHGYAGAQNSFEVYCSDDNALQKLHCTIEAPAAGLHAHVSVEGDEAVVFLSPNIGAWEASKSFDLSGLQNSVSVKFDAPFDISGMWIFELEVIDVDGNMSHEHYELMIENDSIPKIVPGEIVPEPSANGIIHLQSGEIMEIDGFILDNNGLDYVQVAIKHGDVTIWEQEWVDYGNSAFNLAQINFPALENQGQYHLILRCTDDHGWHNWQQATVVVE